MSEVYFAKNMETIIRKIDYSRLGEKVAIKVHFGEHGCNTYINPELVRQLFEKVKSLGKGVSLVECNVLYKGSRVNSTKHVKTAREHGFGMPIDILDGEHGNEFVDLHGCKVGKGIERYDSIIVLSHFKGHMAVGFGGAMKNLGMGLGSRAGKLDMHSSIKPSVNENCIGCGICVENCNDKAISIVHGKAKIDNQKCVGCAMCISVCNSGAVNIPWRGRTSHELQRKITEYCKALLDRFPSAIFINVLEKITKECDCMGTSQKPLMPDIGILYSNDIVAIEKASLDLVNKSSNGQFDGINSADNNSQVEFAEKLGLGSSKYRLVEL
ncbi:MAG: DUF362 domain-containing protein [Candidatus Woesearchaeota archaeon]